jgi:hypothetical protein
MEAMVLNSLPLGFVCTDFDKARYKKRKSSGHIIMTVLVDQGTKEDLFEKGRRRPPPLL